MQTYTRKIWVKMLAVKGAVNDLKCCFVFGCLIVRLQQKVAFSPTTFGLCSQSPACFCQPTNEFIFILIEHLSYEFKSGLYPTILWALSRHFAQCNWIMAAPVKMHQTCMNTRVSISLIHSCSLLKCKHRRSWVIFRGGPTIPSCQNSSPSCQNFFLSGGAKFADSVLPC